MERQNVVIKMSEKSQLALYQETTKRGMAFLVKNWLYMNEDVA